jgi:hypothetical protein
VVSGSNRFLSIGAAAGSLALLAAVVLMLWPPDPGDYGFTPGRDRPDGETVGWVSKVEANTIHVNSGPFGGGVVPLVVTKTTRITVGAKDGWFEDIRPGGQVKVAYELYHGRRFARSVELLVDEGSRRPVRATAPAERVTSAPARETSPEPATAAPAPRLAAPTPVPVAPPPPVVVAPAPALRPAPVAPATAAAKPAPAPEIRPAPRPEPAPARPQPVEIVPPPQRASPTPTRNVSAPENGSRAPEPARAVEAVRPPAPAASRPVEPPRTAESEATDGSAAVDWLLRRR